MSDRRPPGRGPSRSLHGSRDALRAAGHVVLSRGHRLSGANDFTQVIRSGVRAGSTTVVAHVAPGGRVTDPVQIGFIVNKSVGNAVIRNRVRRQLRHLCRPLVAELPPAVRLVVRALPGAATADSGQLAADLESSVRRAQRKLPQVVQA